MNFTEQAVCFDCIGDSLLSILAKPENPSEIGVVVIVGGPQYRAGSHRQFVLLSRALAAAGFSVMRFDYRGMGDSEGGQRDFRAVSADITAAIGELQSRVPTVKKIVLWGLCDGASAALLYCYETRDMRITGLCLLNPWVRSEVSHAQTRVKHYYLQRLRQREFWLKLLSGKVALQAIAGLITNFRVALTGNNTASSLGSMTGALMPFQIDMSRAWRNFNGQILLILSGNDYTAKEFLEVVNDQPNWKNLLNAEKVARYDLLDADHTFSNRQAYKQVASATRDWLSGLA